MAKFALECMFKMNDLVGKLETTLGPDTGDLKMRVCDIVLEYSNKKEVMLNALLFQFFTGWVAFWACHRGGIAWR